MVRRSPGRVLPRWYASPFPLPALYQLYLAALRPLAFFSPDQQEPLLGFHSERTFQRQTRRLILPDECVGAIWRSHFKIIVERRLLAQASHSDALMPGEHLAVCQEYQDVPLHVGRY